MCNCIGDVPHIRVRDGILIQNPDISWGGWGLGLDFAFKLKRGVGTLDTTLQLNKLVTKGKIQIKKLCSSIVLIDQEARSNKEYA